MNKIFSRKLLLRQLGEKDLPLISEWSLSGEAHGEYLSMEKLSLEECQQRYMSGFFWNDGSKEFIIESKEGVLIGTIRYWLKPESPETAVISLKIARSEFRRKGYGYEAQKMFINYLFTNEHVKQIVMYTALNNIPQQKCLVKLGFDFIDSVTYCDQGINRTGFIYQLSKIRYKTLLQYSVPE